MCMSPVVPVDVLNRLRMNSETVIILRALRKFGLSVIGRLKYPDSSAFSDSETSILRALLLSATFRPFTSTVQALVGMTVEPKSVSHIAGRERIVLAPELRGIGLARTVRSSITLHAQNVSGVKPPDLVCIFAPPSIIILLTSTRTRSHGASWNRCSQGRE